MVLHVLLYIICIVLLALGLKKKYLVYERMTLYCVITWRTTIILNSIFILSLTITLFLIFPGAQALYFSYFGPGNGRIQMTFVNCNGSEDSLLKCSYSTRIRRIDTHRADAGVRCFPQGKNNMILTVYCKKRLHNNRVGVSYTY